MSDPVGFFNKLIRAYHGSPYAFDKFDPTKIGSGEGAQAYGYGHYFTDKEDIARGYRDRLTDDRYQLPTGEYFSHDNLQNLNVRVRGRRLGTDLRRTLDEALQMRENQFGLTGMTSLLDHDIDVLRRAIGAGGITKAPGHMYDVNLGVNPQDLLNWDAPLREQPSLPYNFGAQRRPPDWTGRDLYHNWDTPERTAKQMLEAGIPGIKYLDGFSRGAGEGTSNYVMFPGTEPGMHINRRYANGGPVDTPTEGEGGMYGAPDSMFNTPESLAAALYPQHDTAYGGGGRVEFAKTMLGALRPSKVGPAFERADEMLKGPAADALESFTAFGPKAYADPSLMNSRIFDPKALDKLDDIPEMEPLRDRLYGMFGNKMPLMRYQRPLDGFALHRKYLSWTSDPAFAQDYAGMSRRIPPHYDEDFIRRMEDEYARTGLAKISNSKELRRETQPPEWSHLPDYPNIYHGNEHITDTDSVRHYMDSLNEDHRYYKDLNEQKAQRLQMENVPLEDLLWGTDRVNQSEFIVRNKAHGGPVHTAYGGGGKVLRKAGQLARDALLGDLPEYKKGEETYLRYGKWPENERSQNFAMGHAEEGVSVYPLDYHGGLPLDWSDEGEHAGRVATHMGRHDSRGDVFSDESNYPRFLVQGDRVGSGHDGEPLLQDVSPLSREWHSPQLGDRKADTLSHHLGGWGSKLPAVVKPFDDQFADGGPVEMSGGGSELIKRAVGFLRSSRLGDMMNEITNRHGASQGRRFEQASDSANLDRYSDDALRQTFGRSDTGLYTTMPPGRFEDFAAPIPDRFIRERPYFKWQHHPDGDMLSPNQQSYDEYMRHLRTAAEYGGGLDQVPYLKLNKGLPFNDVVSHEGRHRMRMFDEERDANSLVQLLPTGGYGLFDDRVERLMKHYFLHGNETPYMPEKSQVYDSFRPMQQFPNPIFAEGGEVEMAGGGADKIKDAVGFLRRLANYKDAPSKHIDDYQWKPMSEVGERLGQIDAIPPQVENFGAFMQDQAQRAANEGLTPRDLLKAFGISRGSIQRSALPTDSIRATGLDIPGNAPTIRPEGAFATWMGTKPGQSWLDKGQSGIVDFDAINDAQQRLAPFGKSGDLAQFLQWGPENLPGREGRLSELVDRARTTGNSAPEEWKDAVGDLFGIGLAKRGFFSAMLGRGDQPVFDARQIDLHVPKGHYAEKYGKRAGTEGGDEIMARLAARQEALGIGVPKDLMPFQQYLTHHTVWDKLGNEATTHQDLIDSLRGHAEGGPIEMKKGGSTALDLFEKAERVAKKLFGSATPPVEENLVDRAVAASPGRSREEIIDALRDKTAGIKGDTVSERGITGIKDTSLFTDATASFSPTAKSFLPRNIWNPEDWLGHVLVGGMSDRADAGQHLFGVGNTRLRSPLWLPGGSDYPMHHDDLWASDPKALTAFINAADKAKRPALFTNKLMGHQSADQSSMMMKLAVDALHGADVTDANANTFRDYVQNLKVTKKHPKTGEYITTYQLPDFPGIKSENLEEYLMTQKMAKRSELIKAMDTGMFNKMGIPNPAALRLALADPALNATPTGTPGRTIGLMDLDNPINMSPSVPHGSYPAGLRGDFLGGLDRVVRPEHWFPDWFANRAKEKGPAGATHDDPNTAGSFMKSPVTQVLDQRWLDQFMPAFNAAKPGWKEGGTVEDQYHPIWQQGFQAGGQPEEEPRGFFKSPYTPKERAAIAREQNAERLAEMHETIRREGHGNFYKDALGQTGRGVASIAELLGLPGEVLNAISPNEQQRVPDWMTMQGISDGLDRVFPETTTTRGAQMGRELGDALSGTIGLGIANKAGALSRFAGNMGNRANLGSVLAGTMREDAEPSEWQGPDGSFYRHDPFLPLSRLSPTGDAASPPDFVGMAHGGSVEDQYHPIWSQNFKRGGDVHDILGMLGGLAGNLIPIPVLGPMLGKFAGHTLGNLIEGGSDEIGDDAARDFSFGMADPDAQGWAFGGPIGPTLPKDDFTSGGEEPGMPSFGPGIPGFDVDPLRTNPQVARDAEERRGLLRQVQADSQKGLAEQMKAKESGGGGGMGGMLSALAPFASMIPGVGPMVGMGMSMAGKMMAADGGPVSHYADGGSIPAPNGEQPWMYGGGALMARGGYLRGHGGMNG